MEFVFEGFSIREYAAKMRTVDVVKCWPFSGGDPEEDGIKKERMETLLPPITVTKFRWWSHELHKETSSNIKIQQEQETEEEELEIPRNDGEKLEMVLCPVCGNVAAKTVNELNAHADSCFASHVEREERKKLRMAIKAKSKTPKKRSILEIFAVSPRIQRIDDVEEDDYLSDDVSGEEDHDLDVTKYSEHKKKNKKKMKVIIKNKKKIKKVAVVNKLMMDKKKSSRMRNKLKMKKKNKSDKRSIANKEAVYKFKLPTSLNCSGKANGSLHNKGLTKHFLDDVSIHRKKSCLQYSTQKKQNAQTSKLIAKQRNPVSPLRGILKNHTKVIYRQNSSICNLQDGSQGNCFDIPHSGRHVRFSDKDDILGPRENSFPYSEQIICNTYPDTFASQSEQEQSTGSDKIPAIEVNRDDACVSTGNGTGLQPKVSKIQQSDIHNHVNMRNFLRPTVTAQEKEHHIFDKSSSPCQVEIHHDNLHGFDQGHTTATRNPTYAGILRLLPMVKEVHNRHVNPRLFGSFSQDSKPIGKFIDYFEDQTHGVSAVDSVASSSAIAPALSSDFALADCANGSLSCLSQSAVESITGQPLQYRPFCHFSSRELMGPEWKQREVAFGERHTDEGFCGLPLNSQGELIQVSSSGRGSFNQLQKPTVVSSSSRLPAYNPALPRVVHHDFSERCPIERAVPDGHLSLLPVKKNPNVHLPARLGVTDLLNTGGADVHSVNYERGSSRTACSLDSDLTFRNIPSYRCREYDQIQNQMGKETTHLNKNSENMSLKTTQPTMRLMGKDVAIGRTDTEMQSFGDGKFWMDKEIIQEHCPTSSALGSSSTRRHVEEDRILLPALAQPINMQSSLASQSNLWLKGPESKLTHPYFNWKTNVMFHNGDFSVNGNASSQVHPFTYPPSPPVMPYKATNLQEPFMSSGETVRINSQLPALSTPQDSHRHIGWRPAEINYQQNLPPSTRSTFEFPFLHPDCSELVQSSSFPSSPNNLPPWLLHATIQVKSTAMPSQSFSNVGGRHHPCNTTGTSFLTAPTLHHSSISHHCSPMISSSHLKSSPHPASSGCPPLIPFSPEININSSVNMGYRNKIKVKERMKSKTFGVKVPDAFQKTKKRPATKVDDLTRPTKAPTLMQEDASAVPELIRENSRSEMQHSKGTLELILNGDKAVDMGCGPNAAQNDEYRTLGIDSSKVDGVAKSGPIKLSAGTKHILKPSQNMNPDNSRLIHSTIPFVAVTDGDSLSDSQSKSMKIYRFQGIASQSKIQKL